MENQQENTSGEETPAAPGESRIPAASSAEEAELQRLINSGHSAYSRITIMTIIGVILLFAGLMYWDKLDYYPVGENSKWEKFGAQYLPSLIENANNRQASAYVLKPNVASAPAAPEWPEALYGKLRFDIYIISGLVFLLCLIHMRVESAKGQRNDLLLFRTMAREIEKLKERINKIENENSEKNK